MEYDRDIRNATKKALLSGGISGSILGAGAGFLKGQKPLQIATTALAGGATGAGLAGGSTYLGSQLMGAPDESDPSGFTKRAALGGAVGGGGLGALLGGLVGGSERGAKIAPEILRRLAGGKGALAGAAIGALGLGGLAGYYGSDEGMQLDFVRNQLQAEKRKRLREQYGLVG